MSKLGEQIESARREYVAAIGTDAEMSKRALLEWLVAFAKREAKRAS